MFLYPLSHLPSLHIDSDSNEEKAENVLSLFCPFEEEISVLVRPLNWHNYMGLNANLQCAY